MKSMKLFSIFAVTCICVSPLAREKKFDPQNFVNFGLKGTKTIALTFDDGPTRRHNVTSDLLKVLAKYNVKATFFVVGQKVARAKNIMEQMVDDGHLPANHSYTHINFKKTYSKYSSKSKEQVRKEIFNTHTLLEPFLNADDILLFRAPYGAWGSQVSVNLNKYKKVNRYVGPIMWDIGGTMEKKGGELTRAADWACWSKGYSVSECARGYMNDIESKEGGVVLMHDMKPQTVKMVEIILPKLIKQGYKFITLNEIDVLQKKFYHQN